MPIASQLQLRRGTTPQHAVFTGAPAEVTVDTDKKTVVVHDGTTQGGFPLSRESVIATGSVTRRSISDRFADTVNVKDFGAVGNGVADDTGAINAAVQSGAKKVHMPAGTYKILGTINVPSGVSLTGDGITATVLDGSMTTLASLTGGRHIKVGNATLTQLPALSSNVAKGDTTITFSSAPSLAAGDVIVIFNPTDSSWNADRTYYRAGEFDRVALVSGNTVTLQGRAVDDYIAANVDVYKLTGAGSCHFANFSLKGLNATNTDAIGGIEFDRCIDSSIENVRVTNCSYAQILLSQCFNISLNEVTCEEDFVVGAGGGTDYGLVIGNSTNVSVTNGYFAANRHGISVGGGDNVGDVPCRFLRISSCYIGSTTNSQAADFHGNTEYASYDNNVIVGGVGGCGGDHIKITNNQIIGPFVNGQVGILCSEWRGCNFEFSGNYIWNPQPAVGGRGAFIDVGGNSNVLTANTVKGGTIVIKDNVLEWALTDNTANHTAMSIQQRGYNGAEPINAIVQNNTLYTTTGLRGASGISIRNHGAASKPWKNIVVRNNLFDCGDIHVQHVTAQEFAAEAVFLQGNTLRNTRNLGITANNVTDILVVKDNILENTARGIFISGSTTSLLKFCCVEGNRLHNTNVWNGSSTEKAAIHVRSANICEIANNQTGSYNEFLVVASNTGFQLGETITGGTSGATAEVILLRSTNEIMIGTTRSGNFTATETITGGTSSATTTVTTAEAFVQSTKVHAGATGLGITLLRLDNNNDFRTQAQTLTDITGYATGSVLVGSATYDPPNLIDGAGATTTVTVTGAALGDYAEANFSLDLQGITVTAWVSAANTVSVRFQNESGGTLDLGSGTLRARVFKP